MNRPIAIESDRVVKGFRFFTSPIHRLREAFHPLHRSFHTPISVLRDVSFNIARGETVAIIGANGAGKSTLLHMIAGLLEPTSGTMTVLGRVKALLDLGGSFLPDLTGRENVRFLHDIESNGNRDPMQRERVIEAFADIGEFFDRPVHTYSSGLFLRLAFAAATFEDPDILLIDDVLAVGDARLQQKCYRRIRELRDTWSRGLPGQALAVYEPELDLVTHVFLSPDGHASQRTLFAKVLTVVCCKDLWIADRNFSTREFLLDLAKAEGSFIIRQHGSMAFTLLGTRRSRGRTATGKVYEQAAEIHLGERKLKLRRVTVVLDTPTRDGVTELHIMTNLPSKVASACRVAELYRTRWKIENRFYEVTQTLECEPNTMG